jgi:hypothetical protein
MHRVVVDAEKGEAKEGIEHGQFEVLFTYN